MRVQLSLPPGAEQRSPQGPRPTRCPPGIIKYDNASPWATASRAASLVSGWGDLLIREIGDLAVLVLPHPIPSGVSTRIQNWAPELLGGLDEDAKHFADFFFGVALMGVDSVRWRLVVEG